MNETPVRPLVKADRLAELLAVSVSRVYSLASDGTIPSYRLGSAVRFDPVEVLETLKKEVGE